jgi:hypothetical protein
VVSLWLLLNIHSKITDIFSDVLFYSKGYEWCGLSKPGAYGVNKTIMVRHGPWQRGEAKNWEQMWDGNEIFYNILSLNFWLLE